jgi:hypothetical protein
MMRRAACVYFLIALLVSACLDDVWAAATPDDSDDAQAAQDNDYLSDDSAQELKGLSADTKPVLRTVEAVDADHHVAGIWVAMPQARPPGLDGTTLLYLFMSLLC